MTGISGTQNSRLSKRADPTVFICDNLLSNVMNTNNIYIEQNKYGCPLKKKVGLHMLTNEILTILITYE